MLQELLTASQGKALLSWLEGLLLHFHWDVDNCDVEVHEAKQGKSLDVTAESEVSCNGDVASS